jgi:hypothetical protein
VAVPGSSHHLNHQPSLRRSVIHQAMTEQMRISSFSSTVLVRTIHFLCFVDNGFKKKTLPHLTLHAAALFFSHHAMHNAYTTTCRDYTTSGDTHIPFSKLGRSFKLPQTATLALRAPEQYVTKPFH